MNIRNISIISLFCGFCATILRYTDLTLNFGGVVLEQNYHLSTIAVSLCFLPSFIWILSGVRNKKIGKIIDDRKNKVFGLVSLLNAGFTAYCAFNFWNDYKVEKLLDLQESSIVGFSVSGPFSTVCFIMAVYFAITGLIHIFANERVFAKLKIIELIPVIYGVVLIMYVYVHYAVSLLVTENIFTIVGSCALLLALLYKGKLLSQTDDNLNAYRRTVFFTAMSLTISISYFYSNALIFIINKDKLVDFPVLLQFLNLIFAIYILVFLLTIKTNDYKIVKKYSEKDNRYK